MFDMSIHIYIYILQTNLKCQSADETRALAIPQSFAVWLFPLWLQLL